jgi:hypothetical protein
MPNIFVWSARSCAFFEVKNCAGAYCKRKSRVRSSISSNRAKAGCIRELRAARAAASCAIGLNAVGRHEELISYAETAEKWLEENGCLEAKADLLLYRIEALVNLPRYEEAEALLNQADWESFLSNCPACRVRKERLAQMVKLALRPSTDLPSMQPLMSDKEVMIEARRTMLGGFAALTEIMPPELRAMAQDFATKSLAEQELEKDLPDSAAKWALENQKRMDHLTDFLSGKPAKDVIRDYSQTIGRPDLARKLLGESSSPNE